MRIYLSIYLSIKLPTARFRTGPCGRGLGSLCEGFVRIGAGEVLAAKIGKEIAENCVRVLMEIPFFFKRQKSVQNKKKSVRLWGWTELCEKQFGVYIYIYIYVVCDPSCDSRRGGKRLRPPKPYIYIRQIAFSLPVRVSCGRGANFQLFVRKKATRAHRTDNSNLAYIYMWFARPQALPVHTGSA